MGIHWAVSRKNLLFGKADKELTAPKVFAWDGFWKGPGARVGVTVCYGTNRRFFACHRIMRNTYGPSRPQAAFARCPSRSAPTYPASGPSPRRASPQGPAPIEVSPPCCAGGQRTVDRLSAAVVRIVDLFAPAEFLGYFTTAGYDATCLASAPAGC